MHLITKSTTKNEQYNFDKVKLNRSAASGEYNVYAVIVDDALTQATEQWIGKITHESDAVAADEVTSYSKLPIIEWTFRPEENECNDPLTPLVFAIASGVPLLVLVTLGSANGWNLSQFGSSLALVIAVGLVTAFLILPGVNMLWKSIIGAPFLIVIVFFL